MPIFLSLMDLDCCMRVLLKDSSWFGTAVKKGIGNHYAEHVWRCLLTSAMSWYQQAQILQPKFNNIPAFMAIAHHFLAYIFIDMGDVAICSPAFTCALIL